MTTSAPIRKVHNVPIIVVRPKRVHKQLPAPDPDRLIPIVVTPVRREEPVRV